MNEHSFSAKIIKKCREQGIVKAWKINDNFAGGVPDAWFLGNKSDMWVEFKWLNALPKRESTILKPALSALQLSWLKAVHACGRKCLVVIGYPKGAFIFCSPELWEHGASQEDIGEYVYSHNQLVKTLLLHTMLE